MNTNSVSLTSLALLKARYDVEKKDILDTLIPFIEWSLSNRSLTKFCPEDLKLFLLEDFGLTLPLPPVTLLAKRMVKRRLAHRSENVYHVDRTDINPSELANSKAESQSHLTATITGLKEFCHTQLDRQISTEDAEAWLFNYIDEYSIECVRAYSDGNVVKSRGKDIASWRYIVSRYVNHISQRSPNDFDYFVTVLTGRMLSNALIASDLSGSAMQFRNTTVYLDTPIILQLIGLLGNQATAFTEEMTSLLHKSSAKLAIFTHIEDELRRVLRNAEKSLETDSHFYGNVVVALRDAGKTASDVAWIRGNLHQILESKHVTIEPTPPYETKFQIDELALEQEMTDAGLFYRNEAAKLTDIQSVRSAYVLRHGHNPHLVEQSRVLVVTNNSALARAAYSYGRHYKEFAAVSPIITDFSLTNIVWLKSPIDHADLPAKILSAHCYAALKPSQSLWSAFLGQLNKLEETGKISPEQHKFMRFELRVRDELMNLTLGDENELTMEKILQILDRHEQSVVQPWKDKYSELQQDHSRTNIDFNTTKTQLLTMLNRIESIGRYVELLTAFLLLLLCIFLLCLAQGWILDFSVIQKMPIWVQRVFQCCCYLFNILALLGMLFGFHMWNPISRISRLSSNLAVNMIRKFLGITNSTF